MPAYDVEVLVVQTRTINAKDIDHAARRAHKLFVRESDDFPTAPQIRSVTEKGPGSLRSDQTVCTTERV